MKELTGVLIEYLAIGSSSLLWLLIVLMSCAWLPRDKDHPAILALLLPLAYVLGMIGDYFGEQIVRNKKEEIKEKVRKETKVQESASQRIDATIALYAPELSTEVNARSSRDRIARGVLVNIPFIGLATLFCIVKKSWYVYPASALTVILAVLLTFVMYKMWQRFQEHSYKYQAFAFKAVIKKEALSEFDEGVSLKES